jgi:hypothetical protein
MFMPLGLVPGVRALWARWRTPLKVTPAKPMPPESAREVGP